MKQLSSSDLLNRTKYLVAEERKITLQLIECLREVERRLLFADLGYGSLFEYCTVELGLSEGSAKRRIQAMRLVRDFPDAKEQLETGALSLSNAAKVQSFFQMEKKQGHALDEAKKSAVLEQVQNLSQTRCEQKLFEISPASAPRERERVVSASERELKMIVSEKVYEDLQHLRGLLAHAIPDASYAQLLEYAVSAGLEKVKKAKGLAAPQKDPPAPGKTLTVQETEISKTSGDLSSMFITPTAAAVRTEQVLSKMREYARRLAKNLHSRTHIPLSIQRAV